jgi:hypothetical protein
MDIATPRSTGRRPRATKRLSRQQIIWLSVGVVLMVIAGLTAHWYANRNQLAIDSSAYQAVFLDNDQVFFGKLQNTHGDYLTLKNAYYVKGGDQASTDDSQSAIAQAPSTQLLKVSDTVYGPNDTMSIHSSKVLFWQNLKDDSKVSEAINERK